jgi:hypothetical protein
VFSTESCQAGTSLDSASLTCKPCASGGISLPKAWACDPCPIGSYSQGGVRCVACPSGKTTSAPGAAGVGACVGGGGHGFTVIWVVVGCAAFVLLVGLGGLGLWWRGRRRLRRKREEAAVLRPLLDREEDDDDDPPPPLQLG